MSSCRTFPARPFLLADFTFVGRQSSFRRGISSCRISRSVVSSPFADVCPSFRGFWGGKRMVRGLFAGVAASTSAILGSYANETPRRIDWPVRVSTTYNLSLLHSLFFSRREGALRSSRPGNAFGCAGEIRLARPYFRCVSYQSVSAPVARFPGTGVAYLIPLPASGACEIFGQARAPIGGKSQPKFPGDSDEFRRRRIREFSTFCKCRMPMGWRGGRTLQVDGADRVTAPFLAPTASRRRPRLRWRPRRFAPTLRPRDGGG